MKKPHSLYTQLLAPLCGTLLLLVSSIMVSSYFLYRESVVTTSETNLQATGEQLLGTYDSYFTQIFRNSDVILSAYNDLDDESTFQKDITQDFESLLALKEEVISASMYKASTGELIAAAGKGESVPNASGEEWFRQTFESDEDKLIPVLTLPSNANPAYPYSFSLSRYASYDRNSAYDAVLHLEFSFNEIVDSLNETALGEGGNFVIYDKSYRVVYSSMPESLDNKIDILKGLVVGTGNYSVAGHSFFVFASSISNTSWRLGVFLNCDAVQEAIRSFALYVSLIGTAALLGSAAIVFIVARRSVKPLLSLSKQMSEIVTLEDMPSKRLRIVGSKEIVELDHSFSALVKRVEDLTKKIIYEKEEQRKSELLALQNQINPHFLYNTLDSILALIDKKENEKAEEMIVALSRFFRISISKGKNIIPLRKEIEHAKNYLQIQKLRFGDAFDYSFDVDESILDVDVVKLILQPIIENSINHGLKEGEKGFISVKGYVQDGFIHLEISDDGYGMLEETRQALENSLKDETEAKGVGLKNVYLRLRVYYGPKADVTIQSKLDEGTTVSLLIPWKGESHEKNK